MFADISSFESLCGVSKPSSGTSICVRDNVAVQNVQVPLSTLAQITGDRDLEYLVNVLFKRKEYNQINDYLSDVLIRNPVDIRDLKEYFQKRLGISNIPQQAPSEQGPAPAPAASPSEAPAPAPGSSQPLKSRLKPRKKGWTGPQLPFAIQGNPFDLPEKASSNEWAEIEEALRWALKRREFKKDRARCQDTLRLVQYIREKQR